MAGVKNGVSLTHAFKFHKDRRKQQGKKTVDASTFRNVMYSYNKKVVQRVLDGYHTQLPHNMGYLRIVGYRPTNRAIDWKTTKELGETYYHDNRHTDGLEFKWNWVKPNHLVKNLRYYKHNATDGNKGDSMKERLNNLLMTDPRAYKRYLVIKKKW